MSGINAVFFGDSNLLIHCTNAFLSAGHKVACVITSNPDVQEWAKARNILVHSYTHVQTQNVLAEFDYLFCVDSVHTVCPHLMASTRNRAIRFHDSLTAPYTDLHAPSWALINQKETHGVTWHEIKTDSTQTNTVVQQSFSISEQDTAGSLHAKCYEAGLSSFNALIAGIEQGSFRHDLSSSLLTSASTLVPPALGTIDFSQSAKKIAAFVAALDFGPLPNNFGCAKIYLGHTVALVQSAFPIEGAASGAPGFVVCVEGNSLQVATAEGDILLTGCSTISGEPLELTFTANLPLPSLGTSLLHQITRQTPQIAQGEKFWRDAYPSVTPVELPYPQELPQQPLAQRKIVRVNVPSQTSWEVTTAAFFAWLSLITTQENVSIMFSDCALNKQAKGLECWLSTWVPMTLSIPRNASTQQTVALAAHKVAELHQAGPYMHDLLARTSATRDITKRLNSIGISLSGQTLADEMNLMLAVNTNDCNVEFVSDGAVYSHVMLTTIANHFSTFLKAFENQASIAELSLMPAEEAATAVAVNNSALPYDATSSVQALIAAQALRTPHHTAVCFEGLTLSYEELEQRANVLAGQLQLQGVKPGAIIGLCLKRGLDLMVGLLAILKAGAAYLPLDPDYPQDRISYMMEDSQAQRVVTTGALAAALGIASEKAFLLDDLAESNLLDLQGSPTPGPVARLAYLMYTSGSTGRPKGVMVAQQGLLNLFAGLNATIPHKPAGRWLAVTSVSFDISVAELWWPLTHGFAVVIHSQATSGWSVAQAMLKNKITHLFCTPSMVSVLMADAQGRQALSGLSVLMAGGEVFPLQLTKALCGIVPGKVFNVYGPTEITVLSNVCQLSSMDEFVPLGLPIANTTLHVRTLYGAECPAWVPGELLIGGKGVSDGYWHRPQLTAEKFINTPERPDERLYRTGDIVRRRPGGALEFVGRIDHQVKIRGHRIELGEIEKTISKFPGVKEAVVLAPEDKFGDRRLVAYVVPQTGCVLESKQVQRSVAGTLPSIMIPSAVMVLKEFALTPNGKIDRRALPSPQLELTEDAGDLPESALEISIAEVWEKVLNLGEIKVTDNFFRLGGSFFSAVQVQRQLLKTTGRTVHLSDMVRFPTIRQLAEKIDPIFDKPHEKKHLSSEIVSFHTAVSPVLSAGPEAMATAQAFTPVESVIATIWRDLFETKHIDKKDDFFDLGGNSLAAVRMFAQLRKHFPIELPLATLFEASTLAGFANLVAKSNAQLNCEKNAGETAIPRARKDVSNRQSWSPLVAICRGSAKRQPLFCIHGGGGNVFNFKALSQKLGPDQPVYGLQPQGVDGHLPVLESVEAMATQYVTAIRSVDSEGPYRLLGYSAGGVIALEMAQQFKKAGARIELLAMIDTLTPAAAVRMPTFLTKFWLMRRWSLKFALERFRHRQTRNARMAEHAEIAEKLLRKEWLPPELVEPHLLHRVVLVQNQYKPDSYQGTVVLFKAHDATTQYLHAGNYMGWEAHIDGHIKVVNIQGSHNSMMTEPHLTKLSAALSQELNNLDGKFEVPQKFEGGATKSSSTLKAPNGLTGSV